jgi:hypothetical protein
LRTHDNITVVAGTAAPPHCSLVTLAAPMLSLLLQLLSAMTSVLTASTAAAVAASAAGATAAAATHFLLDIDAPAALPPQLCVAGGKTVLRVTSTVNKTPHAQGAYCLTAPIISCYYP